MSTISNWNVDPNLPWWVRTDGNAVSLFLSESDAIAQTNAIASGTADGNSEVVLTPAEDTFTHIGTEYTLEYYDSRVSYHLKVSGSGLSIIQIGPFYDLPDEEHPLYKNSSIATNKATSLIDDATHIVKQHSIAVAGYEDIELKEVGYFSSSRFSPTSFYGLTESIRITLDQNFIRTDITANEYEKIHK